MSAAFSPRQGKRPVLGPRNSSSSQHLAGSPSSPLSSSQKKPHRQHIASRPGIGARVPSVGKINRLGSKLGLTPVVVDETSSAFKPAHIKRNSSNLHLSAAKVNTHVALRKNQSDTSLRKNRSSTQLHKLPKVSSSKRLHKKTKSDGKANRDVAQEVKAANNPHDRAVHFNLGEDEDADAWTEDSASPNTTRDNSQKNSVIIEPPTSKRNSIGGNTDTTQLATSSHSSPKLTPSTPTTPKTAESGHVSFEESPEKPKRHSRILNVDSITSRLLKRNVSFSTAPTKVSSISASASRDRQSPPQVRSRAASTTDSPEQGNTARISNANSHAGTPRESSFLPHMPKTTDQYGNLVNAQKNRPSSGPVSRSDSPKSGILTPSNMPPSRTQQKLWLERASSNLENQQVLPPGILRTTRLGGGAMQFHNASTSDEAFQKQLKQLFEQTDNVYRRIRTFQNPLADAVSRLQEAGVAPKTKLVNKPRGKNNPAAGSGDGKHGLSQSFQIHRASRESNVDSRRPRVAFQGIGGSKDDGDVGRKDDRNNDDEGEGEDPQRDEARDICRRMWERQVISEAE